MYSRGMRTNFTGFLHTFAKDFDHFGLRKRARVGDVEGVADGGGFVHDFEANLDAITGYGFIRRPESKGQIGPDITPNSDSKLRASANVPGPAEPDLLNNGEA
jgi:hypothetical protein